MYKSILLFVAVLLLLPQLSAAQSCVTPPGRTGEIFKSSDKTITFYVPHNAQGCLSSMEGCEATSCPGLKKVGNEFVKKPTCLDAVRLGEAKFVTVASAASNYGKYYNLGTITYRSALDNQMYTVPNVVGYVHDTGCAFNGTCSAAMKARYGFSSVPRPDKLDVCTTVCRTCTDAQASALAQGKNVGIQVSSYGATDTNTYSGESASPFNLGTQSSASPFSIAKQLLGGQSQGFGQGGAGQGTARGTVGARGAVTASPTSLSFGGNQQSIGSQLLQGDTPPPPPQIISDRNAATLVVQLTEAVRGSMVVVSWSTVGMKDSPQCQLRLIAEGAQSLVTTSNNGSMPVRLPLSADSAEFLLRCTPQKGEIVEKSTTIRLK